MNKKLLAAAVAGALAAPGVALAQVTMAGVIKMSVDQLKIGNATSGARLNDSSMRIRDDSSQIHFLLNEDLGGGLSAVAKLDVRFRPDEAGNGSLAGTSTTAAVSGTANPIGTGNTWVGLRSNSWGQITLGRWDLHYGLQPNDVPAKGALTASSVSLMDYVGAGTSTTAIANATRTQNVVKWDSPNWGGFTVTAAYSTSPLSGSEGDMTATPSTNTAVANRKGSGYNLAAIYNAANWQIGGSLWDAKGDQTFANVAVADDQSSQVVFGYVRFGGFKIGAAYKMDERKNALTGVKTNDREAYTVNVAYFTGPHTFAGHFTEAGEDKAAAFVGLDTKAQMYALAYSYDLSKRTAVALTYAKLDNGVNSAYNFFTSTSLGSADAGVLAGEDPQSISVTVRHAF
jgi:predicted porin